VTDRFPTVASPGPRRQGGTSQTPVLQVRSVKTQVACCTPAVSTDFLMAVDSVPPDHRTRWHGARRAHWSAAGLSTVTCPPRKYHRLQMAGVRSRPVGDNLPLDLRVLDATPA